MYENTEVLHLNKKYFDPFESNLRRAIWNSAHDWNALRASDYGCEPSTEESIISVIHKTPEEDGELNSELFKCYLASFKVHLQRLYSLISEGEIPYDWKKTILLSIATKNVRL